MSATAIIMLLAGIFLLYGGLAGCLGIAWYHGQIARKKQTRS